MLPDGMEGGREILPVQIAMKRESRLSEFGGDNLAFYLHSLGFLSGAQLISVQETTIYQRLFKKACRSPLVRSDVEGLTKRPITTYSSLNGSAKCI